MVKVVQSARDLGVILDSQLSLSDHIAAICRAGFYSLRQIRPAIQSFTSVAAKLLSRRSLRVVWTGATRCCMVCQRTCLRRCSRCRKQPLVYLPTHGAVTTSLRCCVNFTGCRSKDEWSLRLRALYTNRSLQRRRRTCLQTFILPPSMVAISDHLPTDHSLFHGLVPDASLSQGRRACGTATDHPIRTV